MVDNAICLSGEITAMMEENETVMNAGDILIHCGMPMPDSTGPANRQMSHSS